MLTKNLYIINTGKLEKTAGNTILITVFISFILSSTKYVESIVTWNGISISTIYKVNSSFLCGNSYRANPHAAATDTNNCPIKILTVIPTEFQNITKNFGVSNKSSTYDLKVAYFGSTLQVTYPFPSFNTGPKYSLISAAPIIDPESRNTIGKHIIIAKINKSKVIIFFFILSTFL